MGDDFALSFSEDGGAIDEADVAYYLYPQGLMGGELDDQDNLDMYEFGLM
jgi:hypothetical protein